MSDDPARRIAAFCLIVGSVVVVVARTAHGDLPTDTGYAALSYVASRPLYPLIHLSDILGFTLWAGGLAAFAASLKNRVAWALGRLGLISVLIGVAVHFTEFSIDGFGLPMLARSWATASPNGRLALEFDARLVLVALGGPAVGSLALAWGSTLALYAVALEHEGYPRWLARTGLLSGVAIIGLATIFYLKPNIYPGVVLFGFGTFIAHGWAIALGVTLWRLGRGPQSSVLQAPSGGSQ